MMAGQDCGRCVSEAGCHGSCARAPDGLAARLAAALRARGDALGAPDLGNPASAIHAAGRAGERAWKDGLAEEANPHGPEHDQDGFARELAAAWANGWRLCFREPGFTPRRHAQPRLPGLG